MWKKSVMLSPKSLHILPLAAMALALTAATPAPLPGVCLVYDHPTGPLHGTIRIVSPCDTSLKTMTCKNPQAKRPVFDLDRPLCLFHTAPNQKLTKISNITTIELNRAVRYSIVAQSGHPATLEGTLKHSDGFWLNDYGIDVTTVTADP